jgi:hypothetical protein
MPEAASKSIQPPTDQDVEASALRVIDEPIERRPTVLCPGHASVDVLGCGPAACLNLFRQKALLINVGRMATERSLHDATRFALKISRRKLEQAEVVAHSDKVIRTVNQAGFIEVNDRVSTGRQLPC